MGNDDQTHAPEQELLNTGCFYSLALDVYRRIGQGYRMRRRQVLCRTDVSLPFAKTSYSQFLPTLTADFDMFCSCDMIA